jgi:hypothetical protein
MTTPATKSAPTREWNCATLFSPPLPPAWVKGEKPHVKNNFNFIARRDHISRTSIDRSFHRQFEFPALGSAISRSNLSSIEELTTLMLGHAHTPVGFPIGAQFATLGNSQGKSRFFRFRRTLKLRAFLQSKDY